MQLTRLRTTDTVGDISCGLCVCWWTGRLLQDALQDLGAALRMDDVGPSHPHLGSTSANPGTGGATATTAITPSVNAGLPGTGGTKREGPVTTQPSHHHHHPLFSIDI